MAVATEEFLHLARPIAPAQPGYSVNFSPMNVNIQPQAILSILDHATRREIREPAPAADADPKEPPKPTPAVATRVIGALIGTRSEDGSEITVRQCFAIPHTETEDQVEVDVDYQRTMLAMTLKASPRESLLGWYTTSLELNSFSALIQNFFASPETGTFPHPALHLTISTTPGKPIETRCYISAPSAVNPDHATDSCLFIEVPHAIPQPGTATSTSATISSLTSGGDAAAERAALSTISTASLSAEDRSAPVLGDISSLATAIESTLDLLTRASSYVSEVLDEEKTPNQALGQYLMNNLSLAPKVDPQDVERDFSNHVQDVLMVSFLANTIRTQIDLAQRLATSPLVGEGAPGEGKKDGGKDGGKGGDGKRDGRREGRGGAAGGGGRGQMREPREPREPLE